VSVKNATCRVVTAIAIAVAAGCGSKSDIGVISGTITADGAPVDMGTIHFRLKEDANAKGAGGGIIAGAFEVSTPDEMPPGAYVVAVQASKKTGRTINDQQRGPLPEMAPLQLKNSPREIELTRESARELKLEFVTRSP
jgi:hypothetical protein